MHVRQLSDELRHRGHEAMVLAPSRRARGEEGVQVVGRSIDIPFNGSVAPICPDPRTRARIRASLWDFRPDVVHVHEPFAPSTGLFTMLESEAPVVAVSHTYLERSLGLGLLSSALPRVWRKPAVWLGVSEATAALLRRYLPGAKVRVVPNGVDVDKFSGATPADLPPGRRLLFVDRLEPRKGFATAVDAFRLLSAGDPSLRLVVVGKGREGHAVERLAGPARDRVVMLGSVEHEDLPRYHAAADLLLAPATGGESFGIVLLEAMAAGLPVVASDIPGYREVVRDGIEGMLVPPEDPDALARAVRMLLADPVLARRLGEAGRSRAERYRWAAVVEEIEAVYREALAG